MQGGNKLVSYHTILLHIIMKRKEEKQKDNSSSSSDTTGPKLNCTEEISNQIPYDEDTTVSEKKHNQKNSTNVPKKVKYKKQRTKTVHSLYATRKLTCTINF